MRGSAQSAVPSRATGKPAVIMQFSMRMQAVPLGPTGLGRAAHSRLQAYSGKMSYPGQAHDAPSPKQGPQEPQSPRGKEASEDDELEQQTPESELPSWMLKLKGLVLGESEPTAPAPKVLPVISSFDVQGIAKFINEGRAKRIVVMCGAGISVAAGIPDFRTPGIGLYSRLEKFKLPKPEAIFSIDFFRHNPEPFYVLSKEELIPGLFKPTPTHHFISLLAKKQLLLRCFTQNIDGLERAAGVPEELIMAAHGNYDAAACIDCHKPYDSDSFKECVVAGTICRCEGCNGLVKPSIVFFGESLPERFDVLRKADLPQCDLLIVLGTSLVVFPFAGLLYDVQEDVPRLLMNREVVGEAGVGYFDGVYRGRTSTGVRALAQELGWAQELEQMIAGASSED